MNVSFHLFQFIVQCKCCFVAALRLHSSRSTRRSAQRERGSQ
jgi:hypothetical protein